MPAMPAVSKVVRVDHHYSGAADPNMQVRNFFQYSGALSSADATTWLTNIVTAMAVMVVAQFGNAYSMVLSELTDLTSNTAPQVQNSTGATGTAGTNDNPAGTALVIRHHIARRYRGGHPRIYFPGTLASGLTSITQWSNGYLAAWVAAYTTYIAACVANTNPAAIGTITHVNISFYQGFTNHTYPSGRVKAIPTLRVTPLIDTILNLSGNATPASQRRRNEQP
jgi:hypothetical protein